MKRYISAILIPCFLLQLFGCYSFQKTTLDNLQDSEDAVIVTKDLTVYNLSTKVNEHDMLKKPNEYFSDYWIVNKDSSKIDLITQKSHSKKTNNLIETTTATEKRSIPFSEIVNISIEDFDTGKTLLAAGITLGILGVIVVIGLASSHPF